MYAIGPTRTALRWSRASAAPLTWYVIAILQSRKVSCENVQDTKHAMNRLTSVIERLANFSSRFAWPFPLSALWGGERKRLTRPTI